MNDLLNNYLQDLAFLVKENYNDSLKKVLESENKSDKEFYKGQEVAYYSNLSLIESQLIVFDDENKLIGKIVPEVGKQADF